MEPSTSKKNFCVHLEKVAKAKKGKPKTDPLNVIRQFAGGKNAFKELKYEDLTDLYKLWCGYFEEIVKLTNGGLDQRLLKADYHGCLLRVADASNPSQIRKFYPIYYQALDTEREKLQYLYSSNAPTLTWNGHHVIGVSAITAFLEQLPVTDHNVINVNPQNMEVDGQSWALVSVLGNVAIAGENHGFSQVFVMLQENGTYRIQDHQYRFLD
ncbi:Nuclear transport factor 2 domain protein [Aphelenchoides besseyi]|nr:Nuclear transport factor 2 domain protein [Aphelenchoides besseyi]